MQKSNINKIDIVILILSFLHVCIFNFLNIANFSIKIICLLIVINVFLKNRISSNRISSTIKKRIIIMGIAFIVFILSALFGKDTHWKIAISNYLCILYSVIPLIYFSDLAIHNKNTLTKIFRNSFYIINGYAILNIIISIIQVIFPGFMAGMSTWQNSFSDDLICGLFGYSCTPQFGLYFIFVFFYNLYYLMSVNNDKRIKLYNYFILFFLLVISMFNDNKAVYIELVLFLMLYLAFNKRYDIKDKTQWTLKGIYGKLAAAFFCVLVSYIVLPPVRDLFERNLIYAFRLFFQAAKSDSVMYYGSAERVYAVIHAFTKYHAFGFGYGVGTCYWQAGNAFGFSHFGLADMGSFLCLSGVWFTVLILYVYTSCFWDLTHSKNIVTKLLTTAVILILFFYSQIITSNTLCFNLIYIMLVLGLVHNYTIIENKK